MAKRRLRAYNATALYMHMSPELLKNLKTKLQILNAPYVDLKLPTFRNQSKKSTKQIKVGRDVWLEGYLLYPDLCKAGEAIEAYWRFNLTRRIPF